MSDYEQPNPPPAPVQQVTGAPPPVDPEWRPGGPSGPRASFGRRLVALIVDTLILGVVFGAAYAIFNETAAWGLWLLIGVVYYALLDGGPKGQTLGKMALGIRVVDFNNGGAIGYGRGVIRYIGRIISGLVCYLGYLWMLWDKEKQCWHDKMATTVVVPVQYYPVS
jgi:uncharacterized RDD family membrane protein YckC